MTNEHIDRCSGCGEEAKDIDVGFCVSLQEMKHTCGGSWIRVETLYEIVIKDRYGNWDPSLAGNTDNEFFTQAEAWEAVQDLRKLGEEWATAEYDVRPI